MKRTNIVPVLVAGFLACGAAEAKLGAAAIQKPDLKECEPLKPKLGEVKKADDEAKKWGRCIEEAELERKALKLACELLKQEPNNPEKITKFNSQKQKTGQKFQELEKDFRRAKSQLEKVHEPLVKLGAVGCHSKVKEGKEIVEKETKKELDLLEKVCEAVQERAAQAHH